jgi:uncharacterized membrane protein YkvI
MRWLVFLVAGVVLSVAAGYVAEALGAPYWLQALVSGAVLGAGVFLAGRDLRRPDG